MNSLQRLEVLSVDILSEHIGVAAEFVVADVIRKNKLTADSKLSMRLIEEIFLSQLAILLPSDLPIDQILSRIHTKSKGFLS